MNLFHWLSNQAKRKSAIAFQSRARRASRRKHSGACSSIPYPTLPYGKAFRLREGVPPARRRFACGIAAVYAASAERVARYIYLRFARVRGTPEYIARGLAAGVFSGLFPIFGLQIAFGIALAWVLRGHKLMAAAGTWISNPATNIPIFLFNFQVGRSLLGSSQPFSAASAQSWEQLRQLGAEFVATLFVGSLAVGSICAAASYFLCLWFVAQARKSRRRSQIA